MKTLTTKFFSLLLSILAATFVLTPLVGAHVVVTPKTAVTAERVLFSVSVPNEKDVDVTELRVTVPSGLKEVTPTVHPGWTIETVKSGDEVSSITWKGGTVPAGQRDDFTFRAQTPEKASELQWKAYQTYADGTAVAWDQKPAANGTESETSGPYSVTQVRAEAASSTTAATEKSSSNALPLAISLVALIVSLAAFLRKKQ